VRPPLIVGEVAPGTPLPVGLVADAPPAAGEGADAPAAAPPAGDRVVVNGLAHDRHLVQQLPVGIEFAQLQRVDAFRSICAGKRVLHVGCADRSRADARASLHAQLADACAQLDGFDDDAEALDALRPHARGRLFSDWAELQDAYDIVIAPEVLGRVADAEGFLRRLDRLRCATFVLTVPDAFQCAARHFAYASDTGVFQEVVRSDHTCWYTPYTIANVLRTCTPWRLDGVWFFDSTSLLVIAGRAPGG
jgi:hypothetical protein